MEAALSGIRPWVDEMVVVDTGSTDDTVAIAKRCGAEVHYFTWCDDFAAARNESLRHAKGKWLFWMDADDVIDEANGRKLQALAQREPKSDVLGYIMELQFPGRGASAEVNLTVVDHLRMFRNLPQLRFEGRIHEQILPAILRVGGKAERTDIVLVHANYDYSPAGQAKKKARDVKLVEMALAERPDHPFALFNAGMTYFMLGDNPKAIQVLTKCVVVSQPEQSQARKAYALLCMAFMRNGQHEAARAVCRNGRRVLPDDAELLFLEGQICLHFEQLAAAEKAFRALLQHPREGYLAGFDPSILGFRSRHCLATVLARLDRCDEAEPEWRKVIQEAPAFVPPWQGLWDLLVRQGRRKLALELADQMLEVPQVRSLAHLLRARLATKESDTQTAYRELKAATQEQPRDVQLLDEFCKFLFQHGSPEETERELKRFGELQPENHNVYQNLGALCLRQMRYAEAIDWLQQAIQRKPEAAEAHFYLGEVFHRIDRAHEARQSWNEAARCASDGPTKEQAVRRLQETGGAVSTDPPNAPAPNANA